MAVTVFFELNGKKYKAKISTRFAFVQNLENEKVVFLNKPKIKQTGTEEIATHIPSPIAGKIIKSFVCANQIVGKNEKLFIIESMKMENEILATTACKITSVSIKEGDVVGPNQKLASIEVIS